MRTFYSNEFEGSYNPAQTWHTIDLDRAIFYRDAKQYYNSFWLKDDFFKKFY